MCIFLIMPKSIDFRISAIGKKIKELRIKAGYTSYERFAIAHDIESKQYWRLESGKNFTMKTLLGIVDIHGMSLKEFFEDLEEDIPSKTEG